MKTNLLYRAAFMCSLLLSITTSIPAAPVPGLQQQIPAEEYAALVDLYGSTQGENWVNNEGWNDPAAPQWFGVGVSGFQYDEATGTVLHLGTVNDLMLNDNSLTGSIPESIGNLVNLEYSLNLAGNQLTGPMPDSLGNLVKLRWLRLEENRLSGNIPDTLANLVVSEFVLSDNELSGSIPESLGHMRGLLWTFDLSSNHLSGTIPESLGDLFLWNFSLAYNQLTGAIPEKVAHCNAQDIYLNNNQLSGSIPEFGWETERDNVDLSHNQLTGCLPAIESGLRYSVDVHDNLLSGTIPDFMVPGLGEFTLLTFLNISENCFDISPGSPVRDAVHRLNAIEDCGCYWGPWQPTVVYQPQKPCAPTAVGDLNGDGCVDRGDLTLLMNQVRVRSKDLAYDLNGDGKVDVADSRFLVVHFTNPDGSACPP